MRIIFCFLLAATAIACARTNPPQDTNNADAAAPIRDEASKSESEIVVEGCKESITLTNGQTLKLKLPGTAGTGYTWTVAASPDCIANETGDAQTFEPAKGTSENTVGYAGNQVLTFKAKMAGAGALELNYVRPFDPKNVEQSCKIKIEVK